MYRINVEYPVDDLGFQSGEAEFFFEKFPDKQQFLECKQVQQHFEFDKIEEVVLYTQWAYLLRDEYYDVKYNNGSVYVVSCTELVLN